MKWEKIPTPWLLLELTLFLSVMCGGITVIIMRMVYHWSADWLLLTIAPAFLLTILRMWLRARFSTQEALESKKGKT